MNKVTKFLISYHINDGRWKGVFYRHCEPYLKDGELEVEYQDIFGTGEQLLYDESIALYDVVFLIISKDYLSLNMVGNGNLERSILHFERHGTKVVLVHAEHCEWQRHEWIKNRGLWPNQSNALSGDWDYSERLNRLVSELIRDVMAEKRDTDGNNSSNEQSERKSDEPDDEDLKKGRAYGEGKYGEGPYGGKNDFQAIFEDALKAFGDSNLGRAIELCEKALSIEPDNIKAMELRGALYSRSGRYDEAIEQFDTLLQKDQNNVNALGGKGLSLLNKKDYEVAYDTFELLIKLEPDNIIAWHSMGESLFYRDSFDEAIKCFDKAIKINPHNDTSWVMKAQALLKKGENESAINCFNEVLGHATNKSYVLLEEGIAYGRMGKKNEELYFYDRAIENNPKYIPAYMQKAHVLSQDEDYEGAIECFRKGIDQDIKPEQKAILWHNLATTYLFINRLEEAYESINRSLELHDNEHTRNIKKSIENEMSSKGAVENEEEEKIIKIIEQAARESWTELDLSQRGLRVLPPEIGRLTNVTILDVSDNKLTSLPADIGKLENLIKIHLRNNQLTSLPPEIGNLTRLEGLGVWNNQLKSLPADIGKLTSLKELVIGQNQLTSLPKEIGQLEKLTVLDVHKNELNYLPAEIGKLTSLIEIDLSDNKLKLLPAEMGKLAKLATIRLADNSLEPLPAEVVEQGGEAISAYLWEHVVGSEEKPGIVKTKTIGNIPTMVEDNVRVKDLLGRTGLVEALANMFVYTKEMEGFTVALFGNWGEGKSTIMKLLEKYLEEHHRKRFVFAKFNTWEYEKTDNIAAGLALEVVKGLKNSFNFLCRITLYICFIVKEHWSHFIWSFIKFGLAILPFILLYFFRSQLGLTEQQDKMINDFLGISLAGAGSILIGFYVLKNFKHIVEHPLVTNLETFLKLPNYGKHLGLVPVLKRHIKILCSLCLKAGVWNWRWGKDKKLIVFVDDLDRCQPKCIAEALDAIRLVMENQNVIVFIGIDHRIAFKAIEKHYEEVGNKDGDQKNGIVESGMKASEIARDYLGKIIQLPIRLQKPTIKELEDFVNERLFPNVVKAPSRDKEEIEKPQKLKPSRIRDESGPSGRKDARGLEDEKATVLTKEPETEITEEEMRDTEDERDEFRKMAEIFGFTNPRQLLRLRNCYRLVKVLQMRSYHKQGREIEFEDLKRLIRMLFWQEFLHNRAALLRGACIKVLYDGLDVNEIRDNETKEALKEIKPSILEVFEDRTAYEETAGFVRMVVLPHSEED